MKRSVQATLGGSSQFGLSLVGHKDSLRVSEQGSMKKATFSEDALASACVGSLGKDQLRDLQSSGASITQNVLLGILILRYIVIKSSFLGIFF